ncbi:hypothetical protein T01_12424 [Trichinella spiralis]|uniref:Uncharacterized protein n=1 Tax=Trichinella spiralis TaxID=6334 RepID=A0A0V1AK15_TRISP|nr:hypothetical protein T01_12424 [Trichinella spiralis]
MGKKTILTARLQVNNGIPLHNTMVYKVLQHRNNAMRIRALIPRFRSV